jgi:hypothetical protein
MTTTPHYSKVYGTSTQAMLAQLGDALEALETFQDRFIDIEFHRRDYTDRQWFDAVGERALMLKMIRSLDGYLNDHIDAVISSNEE